MLARSAYRSGRCIAPNAAGCGSKAWALGFTQHRLLSTVDTIALIVPQHAASKSLQRPRPTVPCTLGRWIDNRRHFSASPARPKDGPPPPKKGEEPSFNPFNQDSEDLDRMMEEYWRSMGGKSRQLRNLFGEFDDALERKEELGGDEEGYGPFDDVSEEDADPFAQDPDQEPAYKTVYLPNEQLDEMVKSGFLKSAGQSDDLADVPLPEAVAALPLQDKLFLKKFFMRIQFAKAHPSATTYRSVWRLFQVVYQKPALAGLFNDHAWAMLWSLEKDMIPKPQKMWLGDLMIHVGANMTEQQWIGYIEALFWHGRRDRAFECWKLGLQDNPSLLWWSVGARLHATENQPEAAKNIIDHVIKLKGTAIPKLYIPTIVCYHTLSEASQIQDLAQKEKRYNLEAVKLYNEMLRHCPVIEQKDYSRVALSFLDAGYFKYAMMVYEHMLSAYPKLIDESSNFAYWEWKFKEAAITAQNATDDEVELRDLTISAIKLLPQREKTRILMGNFMRNLIRRNRIEDALRVAKVMQDLGMQMDTSTYNLLLILFDEHGKIGKFEVLATKMIRRLLEPMFQHSATYQQVLHEPEFQPKESEGFVMPERHGLTKHIPIRSAVRLPEAIEEILLRFKRGAEVQLPVVNEIRPEKLSEMSEMLFQRLTQYEDLIPPADPATFGLLLRRATKSENVLKATSVLQLLSESKIQPSPVLINPLLSMLLRSKKFAELFHAYKVLTAPEGFNIKLNEQAWGIMWSALNNALRSGSNPADGVPSPRQLFNEMVQHADIVPSQEIYHNVLRAFWRGNDLAGAYTAMHGMSLVWELVPHKTSLEITIVGLARMLSRGAPPFQRRHTYWYLKSLASKSSGGLVKQQPPRMRPRTALEIGRHSRRKTRLKAAIKRGQGDASLHLAELRRTSSKLNQLHSHLHTTELSLQKYWNELPVGLNLPKTAEARAAISGALPIELDQGGHNIMVTEDTALDMVSDFIRNSVFRGPWPQSWIDQVVLARGEMGLIDEAAIEARKMNIFDLD